MVVPNVGSFPVEDFFKTLFTIVVLVPPHARLSFSYCCVSIQSKHDRTKKCNILHLCKMFFVSLRCKIKKKNTMSEVELVLLDQNENCTVYTIQFLNDNMNEFEKFVSKIRADGSLDKDYRAIARFIDQILDFGALERYFRPEGKMKDSVMALPVVKSRLRLYCLRLSDKILILGNGGKKESRTYNEDDNLKGYVVTLQRFEELLKIGVSEGTVIITENEIQTNKTFKL